MIVSNDMWLHGFTMFYYRTGCEDVTLDLTFKLLYPRMDTDSPFQSISHIFHISMNLALPTARTLDIILWYSMSCYRVANWKISPAAKMWLWETICFQHVFDMSCTLDIKSTLAGSKSPPHLLEAPSALRSSWRMGPIWHQVWIKRSMPRRSGI